MAPILCKWEIDPQPFNAQASLLEPGDSSTGLALGFYVSSENAQRGSFKDECRCQVRASPALAREARKLVS